MSGASAERDRWGTGDIHDLQFAVDRGADKATIWRPEGKGGILRTLKAPWGCFTQGAHPEKAAGRKDQPRSVGGNCHWAGSVADEVEPRLLRRIDERAHDLSSRGELDVSPVHVAKESRDGEQAKRGDFPGERAAKPGPGRRG